MIEKEKKSPNEGLYLFVNKKRDKVKGLCWHKNGFMLLWKELEQGKFTLDLSSGKSSYRLTEEELSWLAGLPWQKMSQWGNQSFQKFS